MGGIGSLWEKGKFEVALVYGVGWCDYLDIKLSRFLVNMSVRRFLG